MNIEPGTLILVAAGCSVICIVLFLLGTVLNAVGIVFEVAGNIIELLVGLFNLGPVPGCGCIALAVGLFSCFGAVFIFNNIAATCDTASRMLFCSWIGR